MDLSIDCIDVDNALERTEARPFRRTRFRSLVVGKSRIHPEDVYPVAALLSLWGPRLREVHSGLEGDANWRVVWRLQTPLKLIRRQERRWRLRQAEELLGGP